MQILNYILYLPLYFFVSEGAVIVREWLIVGVSIVIAQLLTECVCHTISTPPIQRAPHVVHICPIWSHVDHHQAIAHHPQVPV